jgi:aerobic-type carbon monoxide dehydrogenase small subunit (CoxS/CutS family)
MAPPRPALRQARRPASLGWNGAADRQGYDGASFPSGHIEEEALMPGITMTVNGTRKDVEVAGDTPLLYVLRNDLGLSGPQFGCGLSQCGACSVLVDGKEARSCVLPVSRVAGKDVTTLEGLPARWANQRGLPISEVDRTLHPVQQAWIDEQVPQCGFCQNGMMIKAAELLDETPTPTVAQVKSAFMSGASPHLCRCGSYSAILDAVQRASILMAKGR